MTEDIHSQLKQIKQSFRLLMNGVVSHSMREKGLEYKLNWGVQLPHLIEMAGEYEKNYALAIELWKEDIRECKILALLLMPAAEMPVEVAEIWMEQTRSQEMAELSAFYLYQYLPEAPELAFRWISSEKDTDQIAGYSILSRLFMNHQEPNERGINEFLDQAAVALQSSSLGVKHAAMNCVQRFSQINEQLEEIAKKALNLDFL